MRNTLSFTIVALQALIIVLFLVIIVTAVERSYGNIVVKRVIRVIDGDTFLVELGTSFPRIIRDSIPVRVYGINSPEMHATLPDGTPDTLTRAEAVKSRDYAAFIITTAHKITLVNIMRDKYFRILADVKCDTTDLGAAMIRGGRAVPYFGGTK